MNKVLLICFMGVVILNAEVVSVEKAVKLGESMAIGFNLKVNSSYEEKIKECQNIENLPVIVNVENRKEIMPIVIKSCKENIK